MALRTDFVDDILSSANGRRKFTMINNSDGTVSFEDVTDYAQVGSSYGAVEINEERRKINELESSLGGEAVVPADYLSIKTYAVKSGTINAGSLGSTVETDINRDGYTPVGVIGVKNSGTMSSWVVPVESYISGTKHYLRMRNLHSTTATNSTTIVNVMILYRKNS